MFPATAGAGGSERQAIDDKTQAYIEHFTEQAGDPFTAWALAKGLRHQQPNDVPLRNAEHYLWTKHQPAASLMAPGYLGVKYLNSFTPGPLGEPVRDPEEALPRDPLGELKWGLKALFEGKGAPTPKRVAGQDPGPVMTEDDSGKGGRPPKAKPSSSLTSFRPDEATARKLLQLIHPEENWAPNR